MSDVTPDDILLEEELITTEERSTIREVETSSIDVTKTSNSGHDISINESIPPIASPITTPERKGGKMKYIEVLGTPEHACTAPFNHNWEEIVSGSWVINGVLAGGKKCIGKRDNKICGREFVATRLEDGLDISETKYHPSTKNPAYGCTRCLRAMCAKCRDNYDATERTSPKKRKRGGRHETTLQLV